jgi:hypothetical protein
VTIPGVVVIAMWTTTGEIPDGGGMPVAGHEHNPIVTLRRVRADPGNSNPGPGTFEIICRICGDDPDRDHQEVSAELQQIRGPYTYSTSIDMFIWHSESHG